ncbi:MAG: hypothetical protein ACRDND_06860 [Streptosporangiaceae bacterium]
MRHLTAAHLAAAWATAFAAPRVYRATGRKDGLGTALSNRVVDHAGAARAIWVVGARKVVPDLGAAPRRRPRRPAGKCPRPGGLRAAKRHRCTVLLLRQAIGF